MSFLEMKLHGPVDYLNQLKEMGLLNQLDIPPKRRTTNDKYYLDKPLSTESVIDALGEGI